MNTTPGGYGSTAQTDALFHPEEPADGSGHARSWYAATAAPVPDRSPLQEGRRADVCVIGGGLTGLSAALHLAEKGLDTVLLEANRIGWGASGRNGGQLLTGQRLDQETLEAMAGKRTARLLWDLAEEAKALVRGLIARHGIDCDLRPGALLAAATRAHFRDLTAHAAHLEQAYGYGGLTIVPPGEMDAYVASRRYHGGLWDQGSSHLHPLKFVIGLAQAAEAAGARLYERSLVRGIEGGKTLRIGTDCGTVTADTVVLACNGYHNGLMPEIETTVLPITSFVGVTEPLGPESAGALIPCGGCVADTRMVLDYYRLTADNRLLMGGGEAYGTRLPGDVASIIGKRIAWVFPQMKGVPVDYAWGGRIAITMSRLPHLGRTAPNRYFAQGFSGQGLAIAPLAGKLLAEAVAGQAERFDVYAKIRPRPFPGGKAFRMPLLVLALMWAGLRDRLGL